MDGNTTIMPLSGGDFGGNGALWIMMVFLLLAAGGRGFGNNGYGGGMINNDFLYTNLNTSLGQGFTQVTNQNFALERAMAQGFANQAQCCCETNRNIDGVRADIAGLSGQIMSNNDRNTQSILSAICDLKTSHLQEELQKLRDQNMVLQTTQNITNATACTVEALRQKAPVPAYCVPNPYTIGGCCNYNA